MPATEHARAAPPARPHAVRLLHMGRQDEEDVINFVRIMSRKLIEPRCHTCGIAGVFPKVLNLELGLGQRVFYPHQVNGKALDLCYL